MVDTGLLAKMAEVAAATGMRVVLDGDKVLLEPVQSSANMPAVVSPAPANVQVLPPEQPRMAGGASSITYIDQRAERQLPKFTVGDAIRKYINTRPEKTDKQKKNKHDYGLVLKLFWKEYEDWDLLGDEFKDLVVDRCSVEHKSNFKTSCAYLRAGINLLLKPRNLDHLNPFRHVTLRRNTVKVRSYTNAEIKKIWRELEAMIKLYDTPRYRRMYIGCLLFKFLLLTGVRTHEAHAAKWEHVDYEDCSLQLHTTKGDKFRTVSLNGEAIALLKHLQASYPHSEHIFPPKLVSANTTRNVYQNLSERTGIAITRHDARKLYGQILLQTGASLRDVQLELGHSNISVTAQYYSHLNNEHRRETSNKVGDFYKKAVA